MGDKTSPGPEKPQQQLPQVLMTSDGGSPLLIVGA